MQRLKLVGFFLMISILVPAFGQPPEIEQLSIEQIRTELDQLLDNEFTRATDIDRISAILVRIKNFYQRRPEIVQAQLNLPVSEIETIHQTVTEWLESPNNNDDNRIARMCEVWTNTTYTGSDRIDAALLAYERETDAGYRDFTRVRIEELLERLESRLLASSWGLLESYIDAEVSDFSGNISHSFFTRTVRQTQSIETMELHCG